MQTQPFKAVAAFVLTFLGSLLATIQGRTDLDTMKPLDWFIVVGSALVTSGAVYGVTNTPKPPKNEVGAVGLIEVLLIVILVIVLLSLLGFAR